MAEMAAGLTTAQVSFALTAVGAYGIMLLYVYQVAFFRVVGFEFAGLTSTLDLWSNAGTILLFLAGGASGIVLIAMVFQGSAQLGFNLAAWITEQETAVFAILLVVTVIPTLLLRAARRRSAFDQFAACLTILVILGFCYAKFITGQDIPIWQVLSFLFYVPSLAAMVGANHGFSARLLDTRRYDIHVDGEILRSVRLIRASTSGILYATETGGFTCFINPSKVERIDQVSL